MAPMKIKKPIAAAAVPKIARLPLIAVATSAKFTLPTAVQIAIIPSRNPKSPMRFVMNAFFAASAAEAFEYQKPISK
jgi:hypothetical protein